MSQVTRDLGRSVKVTMANVSPGGHCKYFHPVKVTMANVSPGGHCKYFHPVFKLVKIVIWEVWVTPYQICYTCGHSSVTGHTQHLEVSEGFHGKDKSRGPL